MYVKDKSSNPSAIRSRQMIVNALFTLMKQKKYTSITITDIAIEAQVTRKTFYQHFYSLDDVLDEYIETLYTEYIKALQQASIQSIYEHIPLYFKFWMTHFDFLTLLSKNNLLSFILTKYDELLPLIYAHLPCSIEGDSILFEYFSTYTSGAFWKLLCKWVERGGKETPEQMSEIFKGFIVEMTKNPS